MNEPVQDVPRMVRELTEPYRHTEAWIEGKRTIKRHQTRHPSLLNQLRAAIDGSAVDDIGSRVGQSKPPVALAALDVLLRIEAGSSVWCSARLGLTLRPTVEANLLQLTPHADDDTLACDIQSWWRWARVETMWDGRPRDLRDPCPYCAQRMLRVAWDVSAAWCRECGADWDRTDLGVLGAMIDAQRVSA